MTSNIFQCSLNDFQCIPIYSNYFKFPQNYTNATGYDVLVGYEPAGMVDPPKVLIVGSDVEWKPALPSNPMPVLDYTKLACNQRSYLITRCDSNTQVWDFCLIPVQRKGHTKNSMFVQLGIVLNNTTIANDGIPPIGASHDWHGTHRTIIMFFLGLLPPGAATNVQFFKDTTHKPMDFIPMFPYCALYWGLHPVFDCGDPKHWKKNFVDQSRSGIRWIKWAGFWVSIVCGVTGVSPLHSIL